MITHVVPTAKDLCVTVPLRMYPRLAHRSAPYADLDLYPQYVHDICYRAISKIKAHDHRSGSLMELLDMIAAHYRCRGLEAQTEISHCADQIAALLNPPKSKGL